MVPKVSIVLATYNGERFLAEQLTSIFAQDYQNIELIAVDDVSTDTTVQILHAWAAKHANMKLYVNETNLGFIKNFEKGCNLATGEYIAPCDQDDFWEANKITLLVEAIGNHPLIYHDSWLCDENLQKTGAKISHKVNCKSTYTCLEYAVFARIYGHTLLFTKKLLDAAMPFMDVIPHDWWLAYNATLHGGIKFLPQPLVLYRQHTANVAGIIGQKSKKPATLKKVYSEKEKIRIRVQKFYELCPVKNTEEKKVLYKLARCYQSFSLLNNCRRVGLFFKYRKLFLSVKKQSLMHQYLFCIKMFVKIK